MIHVFGYSIIPSLTEKQNKKSVIKFGPPLTKITGSTHEVLQYASKEQDRLIFRGENLDLFLYLSVKTCVLFTQKNRLNEYP